MVEILYRRRKQKRRRPRRVLVKKTDDLKATIYYHRSYKKLARPGKHVILIFLLLTLPLILVVLSLFPHLTLLMSQFAQFNLSTILPPDSIEIVDKSYLLGDIHMLDFPMKYSSSLFSYGLSLFSLIIIIIASRLKIPRPVALWIMFISTINLSASIFLMLFPSSFPYDSKQFSELYVTTEVNIWLLVPVIQAISLLPLPSTFLSKLSVSIVTLIYSVVFGFIRYSVFMIIVSKISFLFMPVLYFAFGPLMDFFYIVGIYSLYISNLSKRVRVDLKSWKWSY
jgi:hypothetical protein